MWYAKEKGYEMEIKITDRVKKDPKREVNISRLARESKTGEPYLMLWTQSNPTL